MKFKDKKLLKREQKELTSISNKLVDYYGDFYITYDNLRLYIKDNIKMLFNKVLENDKIYWTKDTLIFITGYSDDFDRKYLKILTNNYKELQNTLPNILANLKIDIYCKLKKANPIVGLLYLVGFKFYGSRGKEILLIYKGKNSDF